VLPTGWKMIVVPHEVDAEHIRKVQQLFGEEAILYSVLNVENTGENKKVLIIDNIGMLSRLFAYGEIAFIGGGFQKGGIHNVLEPAVFGLPVIFGPVYEKFVEAKALASLHYVFPVNNAAGCKAILLKLIEDEQYRKSISASLKKIIQDHTGATKSIMDSIRGNKWL
jgi:3-deoxy-D-manno-octulosonic-acid transferase